MWTASYEDADARADYQADLVDEILNERQRQDEKWGGIENDLTNTPQHWHDTIADYNGWARRMAEMRSPDKARRRYIQIAALALAVVECIDYKGEGD